MNAFSIAFNAVMPVFILILIGFVLKKTNVIKESFVTPAMRLVFRACLPALLFSKVAAIDLDTAISFSQIKLMVYASIVILLCFIISLILARRLPSLKNQEGINSKGSFMQGAFRTNYAILSFPILLNLFGDAVVPNMALVTLVVIPFLNIYSILALTVGTDEKVDIINILKKIATNPLILSIFIGFIVAAFKIEFPTFVNQVITNLSSVATPLALISIGAFFHFDDFKSHMKNAVIATGFKLLVFPMIFTTLAYFLGFNQMDIILIITLTGGPTAVSSFALSSELDGDTRLSGNIVILSTLICMVTMTAQITFWLDRFMV